MLFRSQANYEDISLLIKDGKPIYGDPVFGLMFDFLNITYSKCKVDGHLKIIYEDPRQILRQIRKTLGYKKVFINRFSLSPDGQNIAIWFAPDNKLPIRLGLYNFMTKKTIVYCAIMGSGNKPIWLPNSHQVVIYATMEDQNERNTYIIDTETNTIMQITKNDIPLGWINK